MAMIQRTKKCQQQQVGRNDSKLRSSQIRSRTFWKLTTSKILYAADVTVRRIGDRIDQNHSEATMPIKFDKEVSSHLFKFVSRVDIKFNRKSA